MLEGNTRLHSYPIRNIGSINHHRHHQINIPIELSLLPVTSLHLLLKQSYHGQLLSETKIKLPICFTKKSFSHYPPTRDEWTRFPPPVLEGLVEVLSTRDVQVDQGSIWHKNHLLDASQVTYPGKGGGVWAKGGKMGWGNIKWTRWYKTGRSKDWINLWMRSGDVEVVWTCKRSKWSHTTDLSKDAAWPVGFVLVMCFCSISNIIMRFHRRIPWLITQLGTYSTSSNPTFASQWHRWNPFKTFHS